MPAIRGRFPLELQTGVVVLLGSAAELREHEDIRQAYLGEMEVMARLSSACVG